MRIMINGHPVLYSSAALSAILGEINRIIDAEKVPRHNGWLLTVLHTARTLDTVLYELVHYKGWGDKANIREYLLALERNHVISNVERQGYNRLIVHPRNKYMHDAGAMPSQLDAHKLLSEMEACLSIVLPRIS
jgi:hypothetical protein